MIVKSYFIVHVEPVKRKFLLLKAVEVCTLGLVVLFPVQLLTSQAAGASMDVFK